MNKVTYKHGATRKLRRPLGIWYIISPNPKEQRFFNGLPDSDSGLWIPDDNVTKNAEAKVDGYELVYEVLGTPEHDLVMTEDGYKKVPPIVRVGDIVLAKGTAHKIFSTPIMFAVTRDNIVALVKPREEREGYVPPEDGAIWVEQEE